MSPLAGSANQLLLNKFCWMARQLRNFNDSTSITQWSNAMMSVKNLMLNHQETFRYHSSNPSKGSYSNPQHVYSVSPPTTLSYHPSKKRQRVLTPSSTPPLTFAPQQPPALTIHHSRRLSVHPVSTLNNIQKSHVKKRKTTIPPQVDCTPYTPVRTASTTSTNNPKAHIWLEQSDSSKLSPGIHIWHGFYPRGSNKEFWSFRKFNNGEEHKILHVPPDQKSPITVKMISTGDVFTILLPDHRQLRL